jgi:pimeloyl-ACP methyl ester carboxylesterase/DNA-binding CsgD family transcriptional regulator
MAHLTQQIRFCTGPDGVRLAYATCGDGPPLVRGAHWGTTHLKLDWESPIFRPWLSMLLRRHTLIRYDLRGCGLSDRDGVEFSFEKLVADLEAVVDAAGVERFALFGTAGGGMTAMAYAARHPERVTHLIIYGGFTRGRIARSVKPEQLEEARTRLKVMEVGWQNENLAYRQFGASLQMQEATTEQFRSFTDLLRLATSSANAVGLMRVFYGLDLREIAPRVRCPTLVLHAREDAVSPFEEGRSLAGLIPGARFVPLESRNHLTLESEPAWRQLVDEVNGFLPASPAKPTGAVELSLDEITAREREVLELVAQGLDNSRIGGQLGMSEKTVRNHVSTILSKLDIHSRAQVIVRAREAGFGQKSLR